ncbi:MAG: nucleotidyltransferase domain-containing protein [Methylophilaceae bacterium]|nr:nucleotidyltransferase domain-containing protein [Methylophilaceae bacterium]
MRLSLQQRNVICENAKINFGEASHVWLFGSRVDDKKAGGDIDLYIEPQQQDSKKLVDAKLLFLMSLHRQIGDQKIDVVIKRSNTQHNEAIYHIARETGVQLL